MLRRWFRRHFGAREHDHEERGRIKADLARNRTDAIVATDRGKYGRRIADSPIERDLGSKRELP